MTTYNVYDGQVSAGLTIQFTDTLKIFGGGIASATTVYGQEHILSGGVSEGATLGYADGSGDYIFANAWVNSGGLDEGTTLVAGVLNVASGATVQGLTVSGADSVVDLASGATLEDPEFDGGGEELQYGALNGVSLYSTGLARLQLDAGSAAYVNVDGGCTFDVNARAAASNVFVASGGNVLLDGGQLLSAEIATGGSATYVGGAMSGVTVDAGGELVEDLQFVSAGAGQTLFFGTASTTVIELGGAKLISGAQASGLGGSSTVASGGTELDGAGYDAVQTFVYSGGVQQVLAGGSATDSYIGGTLVVSSGGTAVGAYVDGALKVYGGAILSNIAAHGSEIVAGSYAANGLTVGSTGGISALVVSSGASADATAVLSGGALTVSSAGASLSATIGSGATEKLVAGGTALNDQLLAGGALVDNGAPTVSSYDTEHLAGRLTGSGLIVAEGQVVLDVTGGATGFTGELVLSGGSAEFARATGLGTGSVAFEATSGTLKLAAADVPASGSAFASPLVDFDAAGQRLDLLGRAFVSGATATLSGYTLTLKDGAYTARFALSGAAASRYVVASDGHGGTLIHAAAGAAVRALVDASAVLTPTVATGAWTAGAGASWRDAADAPLRLMTKA